MPTKTKRKPKAKQQYIPWWQSKTTPADIKLWRSRLKPTRSMTKRQVQAAFDKGWKRAKAEGWTDRVWRYNDVLAISEGCYFDAEAAVNIVEFFPKVLRHSIGRFAAKPFELSGWQQTHVVEPAFGWKAADGFRRFRISYTEIPKKNGKSTLCTALALVLLVADDEAVPEVFLAAYNLEQASRMFKEARRMVFQSPALNKRLQVLKSANRILYEEKDGTLMTLSADVPGHEGLNIHGAVVDEMHRHKTEDMWDTLRYGGRARDQSLIFCITTAGEYDPERIGWKQHDYATNVLECDGVTGFEDTQFLPVIYNAGPEETWTSLDWTDMDIHRMANPELREGGILKEKDIENDIREAANDPTKLDNLKRRGLNIWVRSEFAWMDMKQWGDCADSNINIADLAGRQAYGGMDLSQINDLTAFDLILPPMAGGIDWSGIAVEEDAEEPGSLEMDAETEPEPDIIPNYQEPTCLDEAWVMLTWCWMPKEQLDRMSRKNRAPYSRWYEAGELELTPGERIDQVYIAHRIEQICADFDMGGIAYDKQFAEFVAQYLEQQGFDMIAHGAGASAMNLPMRAMERLVFLRALRHQGYGSVSSQMSNIVAKESGFNHYIRPMKASLNKPIDVGVAGIYAMAAAMLGIAEGGGGSTYMGVVL